MSSICIFGVFVADLCFFGNKIPERGETVLGNNHLVGPGGKGSNQAIAAAKLVIQQGAIVDGFSFVVELDFLKGRERLDKFSKNINSIVKY